MEIQLQELIEQIKKDGVAAAESQAASILTSANAEAEKIIADAKAEAEKLLQNAKEEQARLVRVSEDAIRQAGRNLLISFRERVNTELNAIVNDNVNAAYSSDSFAQLIVRVVEAWANHAEADDLQVLLNANDLTALEETLLAAFKSRAVEGITLKANDNFDGGFRIAVDKGRAYYDYSAAAVVEMLSTYLNPKVTALMKEAENL